MVAAPSPHPRHLLRRIGDLLLTTPLIRSLRRAWPESEIDVLVFANTAGIPGWQPGHRRVIAMPERPTNGGKRALFAALWRRYDIRHFDPKWRPTDLLCICCGPASVPASITDGDPWLARHAQAHRPPSKLVATDKLHRVEQMLRLADALEIPRIAELVCPASARPSNSGDGEIML